LVPRSPPGLPVNVLVYAVAASATQLKVTWQQGETYGAAITSYALQYRDTSSLTWTAAMTVSASALAMSGNTTFVQYLTVPNAYHGYEVPTFDPLSTRSFLICLSLLLRWWRCVQVRVVAYNDQSFLPYTAPAWFRKVTSDPPLVTAVATAFDYHNGSQRATPTCEPALEQVKQAL